MPAFSFEQNDSLQKTVKKIARGVFPTVGSFAHRAARAGMKTKPQMVHNLKAVYVRPAAMNDVNEFVIMKQTGHRGQCDRRNRLHSFSLTPGVDA